ncbi:MAG: recombinase family protein [Miniphocaeibacter sp.]|uniref:recombinase family protein n=1 Tax=Miniphocaeibacter sp. TaxID=3100973 RepID=UPI0017E7E23E|nr:recombinase family protein [Gallicola sp.]
MIFGYARVSTEDQNLNLQIDALEKYGIDRIFKEKVTGANKERPELKEMEKLLTRLTITAILIFVASLNKYLKLQR